MIGAPLDDDVCGGGVDARAEAVGGPGSAEPPPLGPPAASAGLTNVGPKVTAGMVTGGGGAGGACNEGRHDGVPICLGKRVPRWKKYDAAGDPGGCVCEYGVACMWL